MNKKQFPELLSYNKLKDYLESERKALLKIESFSQGNDFLRSTKDALAVLKFLEKLQVGLYDFFMECPSLVNLFNQEFIKFSEFIGRDNVLELCFINDFLLPEQELFRYSKKNVLSSEAFDDILSFFDSWIQDVKNKHQETQKLLKEEEFDFKVAISKLDCQCIACQADYRTKLRERIFHECLEIVESTKELIESSIGGSIASVSKIYRGMQKQLDQKIYKARYRLKRGSIHKLETQIKHKVKTEFTCPSDLAVSYVKTLDSFFSNLLKKQGLRRDLVSDVEYSRFFKQLSTNIWRNELYLEREFKKLVKSVLMLKRKDISASILKEYLGEFWLHSAVRNIKRKIIYHMGPTNSGKTYHAIESLCSATKGCYLAPLRLLAAELYDTLNDRGIKTTLLTGEEVIQIDKATHYSSTIEMARFQEVFDCVVIDEIQMINDPQRGWAWTRALVNIFSPEVHICGDDTVLDLIREIVKLCGDTLEIKKYQRMTELVMEKRPITLGQLKKSDALIVFSRRNALKYKMALEQIGFKVSIVYGRLSPEVRREQARKFDQEETDIIVATDAIAMGMNLPIKRIVFSTLSKYIDNEEYKISHSEIKQIAGRSGRYQRFPTGYINCLTKVEKGLEDIAKGMGKELPQKDKCMVGPDLDIYRQVNKALETNSLPKLKLSEFLRLFNTMVFKRPFYCVDLKEMIELAEMVEEADAENRMSNAESFGFACAPVNLGMVEHVHYFVWILNHFVNKDFIKNEEIDYGSDDIDYLETSIKCVELYQWLARHFNNKFFDFNELELLENKGKAIEKLNDLLSDKIVPTCSSCGKQLMEDSKFAICEECFKERKFARYRRSKKENKRSRPGVGRRPSKNIKKSKRKYSKRTGRKK